MNGASSVDTIEELAAGATDRRPVRSTDAKSGAEFELLTVDGRPFFLKVLDAESRCGSNACSEHVAHRHNRTSR